MKQFTIEQTVALPCYNGKDIGWLAMEGLCHQQPTPHNWELLICEEAHPGMLGARFFNKYIKRLRKVGCKHIEYIKLDRWLPLPLKWKIMGEKADRNSKSFLLQAVDDYSPSLRLNITQQMIEQGYEWVDFTKGYFYSFPADKIILYDKDVPTGLHMGIKTELVRNIPCAKINRNIDGFLYRSLGINKSCGITYLQPDGLDTDGFNNISKQRAMRYDNPTYPFKATDMTLDAMTLPDDVKRRIKNLSNETNYNHSSLSDWRTCIPTH